MRRLDHVDRDTTCTNQFQCREQTEDSGPHHNDALLDHCMEDSERSHPSSGYDEPMAVGVTTNRDQFVEYTLAHLDEIRTRQDEAVAESR